VALLTGACKSNRLCGFFVIMQSGGVDAVPAPPTPSAVTQAAPSAAPARAPAPAPAPAPSARVRPGVALQGEVVRDDEEHRLTLIDLPLMRHL
jgi:hypothetical protein